MGVTSLWQILQPCARPIKLETLNRKRLAVDASIWIYQFLKAVRDKEGNALRNSHVVGFFRRICKLLFFGIKPVFVFDGGAPALKRQVIRQRKQRREGRREDAVRTAGKLLAVQMQRLAEEEDAKRREEQKRQESGQAAVHVEEEVPDEGLVYVEEQYMTNQERQQSRKFTKKDAYHLPELDNNLQEMGQPNDPRIMSLEELENYARQFDTGEDINVYDFANIDYDGPFFMSLPAADRYNILNAARLRSRLRMGHSKEQLDSMFPDRMAFSRFQIERVRERNELTQRLMHLNGPDEDAAFGMVGINRVAGEKGREYVLVRNDGVEGGWALGVIGGDEGTREEKAIDVDRPSSPVKGPDSSEDEAFEDVPIEGLNRLPKRRKLDHGNSAEGSWSRKRRQLYNSRREQAGTEIASRTTPDDTDELFIPETTVQREKDDLFGEDIADEEDEDLSKAIALSLQQDQSSPPPQQASKQIDNDEDDDDMRELFHQEAVEKDRAIPKGSGRAIASIVNQRALKAAPDRGYEKFSFGVPVPVAREATNSNNHPPASDALPSAGESGSESDEDITDFRVALAQSRKAKRKEPHGSAPRPPPELKPRPPSQTETAKQHGFSGPLPFKPLDLGSSILGKKKMQTRTEENAGGFVDASKEAKAEQKTQPLPPWFTGGDINIDVAKQRDLEAEDRIRAREYRENFKFDTTSRSDFFNRGSRPNDEVIDLDAEDDVEQATPTVIRIDDDDDDDDNIVDPKENESSHPREVAASEETQALNSENPPENHITTPQEALRGPFAVEDSDDGGSVAAGNVEEPPNAVNEAPIESNALTPDSGNDRQVPEDESLAWSESEDGTPDKVAESVATNRGNEISRPSEAADQLATESMGTGDSVERQATRSPSLEFEEVGIPDAPRPQVQKATPDAMLGNGSTVDEPDIVIKEEDVSIDPDFDDFSDPDDQDLLQSLEQEAQEHARFAADFNQKTQAQNMLDYERELKQLRNQQKKDRRDADEVTQVMIQECQQLLRLFGLPYVTAPMEAEAQCAELVHLGLVDGIVTDDSDCFLFGGTRIYKNMFNQAKFVECYLASDLEKEFDLTRQKLIAVAQLLGSDYTEGLPGIGPVNALEIIGEFGGALADFKDWWSGVQMNTITKADDATSAFRKKFRKNATKLFLPPNFPDVRVERAYLEPEVDSDPEAFQWGVPDLDALRLYLMSTIGWSQERTDEVLVPVIRDMNRRAQEGTQANLTAFFEGGVGIGAAGSKGNTSKGEGFAPRRKGVGSSKRMGSALTRMAENAKAKRNSSIAGDTHNGSALAGDQTTQQPQQNPSTEQDASPDEQNDEHDGGAGPSKGQRRATTSTTRSSRARRKATK